MRLFQLPDPIMIDTQAKAIELAERVRQSTTKEWAIDTETTGLSIRNKTTPMVDMVLCWSLSDGENRYFIWDQKEDHYLQIFKEALFENKEITKVFHNYKYDAHCLNNHGIQVEHNIADTMVLHWLADERKPHDLKSTTKDMLGIRMNPYSKVFARRRPQDLLVNDFKSKEEWEKHLLKVVQYASLDAYATIHLYHLLKEALQTIPWKEVDKKSLTLWDYYQQIELPFTHVLFKMEQTGVCIDPEHLHDAELNIDKRIDDIQSYFNILSGKHINLNSTQQLRELFYVQLKLPVVKKTKGGTSGNMQESTDEEALEKLREHSPEVISKLLEYRKISKLKSTYIKGILRSLENSPDGRLHPTYNQHITKTGRLSSSNPNSQNMPGGANDEFKIRESFIATPGKSFIIADYSQAEVRLIADLSGDENLIEDLKGDVYKKAYARMFNLDENDVTKDQRKLAKVIVLGTNYGMGSGKLADQIESEIGWENTPFKDLPNKFEVARNLLKTYFYIYKDLSIYVEQVPFICKIKQPIPHVRTLLGRYRRLPEILGEDTGSVKMAEREAVNTGPQAGVADIMRGVMLQIENNVELQQLGLKQLLQIHDEIVVEIDNDKVDKALAIVTNILEHPLDYLGVTFKVPLKVEIAAAKSWKK